MSDAEPLRIETKGIGVDRRERRRRLGLRGLALSGAALVAITILGTASPSEIPCLLGLVMPLTAFVSLIFVIDGAWRRLPAMGAGFLLIEDDILIARGTSSGLHRRAPIGDIAQGWWEEPDRVHLALRSGDEIVIEVPDAAEGERLLRAVGVTAAERILRVPLASAASQLHGGTTLALLTLVSLLGGFFLSVVAFASALAHLHGSSSGGLFFGAIFAVALAVASYGLFAVIRRREAIVGTDGVVFRRSFGRQVYPYADVASVALDSRGVLLKGRRGGRVLLPTRSALGKALSIFPAPGATPVNEADRRRRLLRDRIHEAMRTGGESAAVSLERLDRAGRSIAAWREALGKLGAAGGDYRSRPLSSADLGGVIEDPTAPVERRIAAAVALAARERGEARRRVRIAAQACADEELAAALEQAAEGEIAPAVVARKLR